MKYKAPKPLQLSNHNKEEPILGCQMIWCSIASLHWSIFLHTCDSFFHGTTIAFNFLQYFWLMKELHSVGLVRKFHHSLQNKAFETSCSDLNRTPPSSVGKHNVSHDTQCIPFSPTELLQKNCANILCNLLITPAGGFTADSKCIGILWRTWEISTARPPTERSLPFYDWSLSST